MIKHLKSLLPSVVVAMLVATAANGAYWQWSKTAGSNASADPTINWAEGQSPSSINDSARALMARAAEYRDDISGSVTTGGTSTAYTATSNQGFNATPVTGQLFAFTPHATNGIASTLTVDSGTAWPIQTAPGTAVPPDTLVLGTPYSVKFNGTAWMLRNFYANSFAIPIGGMMPYHGATAPNSNFIIPYGQCISRTTYATFFALVSTTYGVCDGTTTFAAPDYRGRIPVQLDTIAASAANRLTNSATGCGTAFTTLGVTCANGGESQTLTIVQMPSHTHTDSGHTHPVKGTESSIGTSASTRVSYDISLGGSSPGDALSGTANLQNTGGNGAHPQVMPVMGLYYILRVL